LNILSCEHWYGLELKAALVHLVRNLHGAIAANPELFLPVTCLFVWQVTAIAAKPMALGFALLLTVLLFVYGYRVLGKSEWLRRVAWVPPRQGFWFYSFGGGIAAAAGVWWIARVFNQSLGSAPPPYRVLLASSSGPMIEEMLFRGLLFCVIFELLRRGGVRQAAAVALTVFLTAIAFAISHNGRQGLQLYSTILTGIAFGWMRVRSGSSAAASLMHAVYNLVLSLTAMFLGT
jgi:membrane protease YdiL (CAAX protease family)